MKNANILLVDDEPNNLLLLETDLHEMGHRTFSAKNGQEALIFLEQHADIQLILLDRMMPGMDGIEFLKLIKNKPELKKIPVIMQTAAAQPSQISEGINAGAYYYVTKPYDINILHSIITAALEDYHSISELRSELIEFKSKLGLIQHLKLEYKTLEEAKYLSTFLSNFFPQPEKVILGLFELLVNAVEHGNLEITYDEKTQLNINNQWNAEILKRLENPQYANKKADVEFIKHEDTVELIITDEGNGFEWENYLELSAERCTDNHGRGIAMSNMISFDELEYVGKGNQVKCRVKL